MLIFICLFLTTDTVVSFDKSRPCLGVREVGVGFSESSTFSCSLLFFGMFGDR